jgi:chromosome segregation ATPase
MTLQELLKSIEGLTEEQQKAILEGMKKNKIFTASEENLDVRYSKLKTDHDNLTAEHKKSTDLIAELQKATKGQEAVQGKITEYEATIKKLQEEAVQAKTESALKIGLLSAGACATVRPGLVPKTSDPYGPPPLLSQSSFPEQSAKAL